jgi:hypothetical protein
MLIGYVIQLTIQVMNKTEMEVLSCGDRGLWMELCQESDRW